MKLGTNTGGKETGSKKHDEFLSTLISIFTTARLFGIPAYGGNIALCWAIVMLLILAALEIGAIWKLVRMIAGIATNTADGRGLVGRLSGSLFYGNALLSLVLSWKLIYSWRSLSFHWMRAETLEVSYFHDNKIKKRIILVTSFVAICAVVEHMMSMISATGFDIPPEEYFQRYILSSHGFLFQPHEYTLWLAIPVFILSKTATILWNFQDLIIILISMGLTSRYHRLNLYVHHLVTIEKRDKDVQKVRVKSISVMGMDQVCLHNVSRFRSYRHLKFGTDHYAQVQVWRRLREAYVRQAALVRMIDVEIGTLVLLSNLNNLYFICLQLYLGINKSQGALLNRVYYFYSLSWLLLRACSVVLAAANVNVYSRRALPSLYGCPGSAYNIEIKRLKDQLTYDVVALSGMGFFSLDRQLLLEVAAAILKYELVLIQYDK